MGDLARYSDEELRAMLKQSRTQESVAASTHFGQGGSGSDFQSDFGVSGGEMFRAGIGRGLTSIARNASNIGTWITNPAAGPASNVDLQQAGELDKALLASRPGGLGNIVGQAAATAPAAMLAGGVAANPIARGAIEGGVQGLLSADPEDRLKGTAMGAGVGAAVPAIGMGLRRMAYGVNATPEARLLRGRGIDLTPGQMNPEGLSNTLEQAWSRVPVVGESIRGARESAEQQFKQSLIEEGVAPGAAINRSGDLNAMLSDAYDTFDPAYDSVRHFPVTGTRTGIARGLAQTADDPAVLADENSRRTVANWLRNQATQLPSGQALESGDLLNLRSEIRARIRGVSDDAQRDLLQNAEQTLTTHLNGQLPPDAATSLAATDAQYSRYKVLENALRKGGDRPGGFTPSQLSQAIREATDSGIYARGGGQLRDLAAAGANTFQTVMPNTGGRNAAIGIPLAAAVAKPTVGIPLGAAALGMVGTQTGRALAAGETAPQQLLQAFIEGGGRALSPSQKRLLSEALQRMAVAPAVAPRVADTGSP